MFSNSARALFPTPSQVRFSRRIVDEFKALITDINAL
jgi:hypothetical protein